MRIIPTNNQHSPASGDRLPQLPSTSDIRAARCTIHDRSSFLENLRTIAADHDTHIICFNAELLAGRGHAAAAVARAVRAFEEGHTISNTLEMEALLFAAGSRQCNGAASFGIHEGENKVYICCYPVRPEIWDSLEPDFHFEEGNWDIIDPERKRRLMKAFVISDEEIAAAGGEGRLVDLVLERVALLQVMR